MKILGLTQCCSLGWEGLEGRWHIQGVVVVVGLRGYSVCCMRYGVCVFGALGLYIAAACWLLPAAAARNLMFLHYDHNVD